MTTQSKQPPGTIVQWAMPSACALFAVVWYYFLLDPDQEMAQSRWVLFFIGLVPVGLAIALSCMGRAARFAWVAVVAVALPIALRTPFHPLSPDISFHMGKTLWAAAGQARIDPVIGVTSPYPAAFHYIWGAIVRVTGVTPSTALRFVSVFNLIGLWLVIWWVLKRLGGASHASVGLFVASLTLYTKDISEVLFASPGSFSMPFAILGWYLWTTATEKRGATAGAIALSMAVVIWPTHLFGALGVGLIEGRRRLFDPKSWEYLGGTLLAVLVNILMRAAVPGHETWAGLSLVPTDWSARAIGELMAIVSLGSHYYGWIPTILGAALLTTFLLLTIHGWRRSRSNRSVRDFGRTGIGLMAGTLVSAWFLPTGAHMVRLEFVACMAFLPLATTGFELFTQSLRLPIWARSRRLWIAGLSAVWLIPFLAAASASTERQHQWLRRTSPVTEYLNAHSTPGDRIWATPDTYRWVALGKTQLFGFLAHDWPMYFTPPRDAAREYGESYLRILNTFSADSAHAELIQHGVDWIVIDRFSPERPKWDPAILPGIRSDTSINGYTLYGIAAQPR